MCMKIRPLHDRVIVKRWRRGEDKGWDHHSDTAKEKPIEGRVIAVGTKGEERRTRIALEVKKGDDPLTKYGGTEVKIEGEEHLMMREDDILAVIE